MSNGDTNTRARERAVAAKHHAEVARLNDRFRTGRAAGRWLVTPGVTALGPADMASVLATIRAFTGFTSDNDPYGEHDFGSIDHAGERIFWKIDYYNETLEAGSLNPADPNLTVRVLTVMLASEY